MIEKFYSHGKLLITGEYLVLHGAKALAIPVNLGQELIIEYNDTGYIDWYTYELNHIAFTAKFQVPNFTLVNTSDIKKAKYITKLLMAAQSLNPAFLANFSGARTKANIQFNLNWGMGSSSTLINNIAQWAKVNPFELNRSVSRGSGYDIACASADSPIIYQLVHDNPIVNSIEFNPPYLENLTLVYLNKKEATEKNITKHLVKKSNYDYFIDKINTLTNTISKCNSLETFIELIKEHEHLLVNVLLMKPVKEIYFSDFEGAVKSLGAWGGDFALSASALSFDDQCKYFSSKGFTTVIPLKNLMI